MIKSMTGFGRSEVSDENRKIIIEMKSVNHRYFDLNIRMPKKLNFFDSAIRNVLKKYVKRGKLDLFVTYEDTTDNKSCIKYNDELAKEYVYYYKKVEEEYNIENDLKASILLRSPEVLTMEEQHIPEEELWKIIEKAVNDASEKLVESRIKEGNTLRDDMLKRLDIMLEYVGYIELRSPDIILEYRKKIEDKVRELIDNIQVDESRLLTEVVLFADKICVDEEIVRLKSHVENMREVLINGGEIGRKLDFIAQEMNREANTILSKTNDLDIAGKGIELKTDIEKVREQIQNIE